MISRTRSGGISMLAADLVDGRLAPELLLEPTRGPDQPLIVSTMWTGMRIVRAWSAMARVIACRIHHVA